MVEIEANVLSVKIAFLTVSCQLEDCPPVDKTSTVGSKPLEVLSFHSSARWQLHLNESKDSSQLVVIDFSASWCGPCKFIEPEIHALANKYTDVEFVKIDVDELTDVAQEFQVQAMPTFVLVKKGLLGPRRMSLRRRLRNTGHHRLLLD
ncbi:Thioredoxin [Quillaja saponaria]|uniref:Thioredoxin n=1 Tax=Quillaja saponaria TaxID=32244 RepID=A0AAD7VG82_QUISA|nr:Thioredoxin [Quillaja saponaria]